MYYERQQIPIKTFILSHMAACNTLAKKNIMRHIKKSAAQQSLVILKNECQSLHNTRDTVLFLPYPVWLWQLDQAPARPMEDADSADSADSAHLNGARSYFWIFLLSTKKSRWKHFL